MLPWLVAFALLAFVLYTRFAGKAASDDVHRMVAAGARLVDVRSPGEFTSGHLDGAVNIPVSDVERRAGELEPKDKPVVVYCASGARSASAARTLKSLGFTQVLDLGAMSRW